MLLILGYKISNEQSKPTAAASTTTKVNMVCQMLEETKGNGSPTFSRN